MPGHLPSEGRLGSFDMFKCPPPKQVAGICAYLRSKYADSPRPSGTPLINAGGKIRIPSVKSTETRGVF